MMTFLYENDDHNDKDDDRVKSPRNQMNLAEDPNVTTNPIASTTGECAIVIE